MNGKEVQKYMANKTEKIAQLKAELATAKEENKRLNELVFAYESVNAPVNPLLAENTRLRQALKESDHEMGL